jgi:hypothetical protein
VQIKETPDVSFVVKSPLLKDVIVLADSAGVTLRVQRSSSTRVWSVREVAMEAASSRPGAWRFRSWGATARSPVNRREGRRRSAPGSVPRHLKNRDVSLEPRLIQESSFDQHLHFAV